MKYYIVYNFKRTYKSGVGSVQIEFDSIQDINDISEIADYISVEYKCDNVVIVNIIPLPLKEASNDSTRAY